MKVAIDIGHLGKDSGAVGFKVKEADINKQVFDKITALNTQHTLIKCTGSLQSRVATANNSKADVFISLHCNAGGGQGTETYHSPGSTKGKKLAEYIQRDLISVLKRPDRGVKSKGFYVIKHTKMPAVLVEMLFIDNKADNQLLIDSKIQEAIARCVLHGANSYFGIKTETKPPPTKPVPDPKDKRIAELQRRLKLINDLSRT